MLKDRFGNVIAPGVKVTCPGRQGSSLWMTDGEVVDVTIHGMKNHWPEQGPMQTIPDATVVVRAPNNNGNLTMRSVYNYELMTVVNPDTDAHL